MSDNSKGMRPFFVLWGGQFLSVIGSTMTQFALAIWIWEQTNTVTPMILTTVFFFAPTIFIGPIAGALVDRWDRKRLMVASDTLAGLASVFVLGFFAAGQLEVWHLYITAFLSGAFQSLQAPALMASVSTLVPQEDYPRAASLLGLSDSMGQILAPVLAGLLYAVIGVNGILLIDFITFIFAVSTLLFIHIPRPEVSIEGDTSKGSLLKESLFGFQFLLSQRNLLALFGFMLVVNVLVEPWASMLSPLVLARSGGDTVVLAIVQFGGFVGAVIGGIAVYRVRVGTEYTKYLLIGLAALGLLTLPIGLSGTILAWMIAHFMFFFLHAFIGAYHHTIWQLAVPADVQGRVFAVRRLTFGLTATLSPYFFGQLADQTFEPAFQQSSQLQYSLGWFVGNGTGAGIAAIFVICSALLVMLAVAALAVVNRTKTPSHMQTIPNVSA